MDRCWLQGALGDALHTLSCAVGYNLRWLIRTITQLGLGPAFFSLLQWAALAASAMRGSLLAPARTWAHA